MYTHYHVLACLKSQRSEYLLTMYIHMLVEYSECSCISVLCYPYCRDGKQREHVFTVHMAQVWTLQHTNHIT